MSSSAITKNSQIVELEYEESVSSDILKDSQSTVSVSSEIIKNFANLHYEQVNLSQSEFNEQVAIYDVCDGTPREVNGKNHSKTMNLLSLAN